METINEYQQQAIDFLTKTNTVMEIKFKKSGKYFNDDKEVRDIYEVTLFRNGRKYTFDFGNSLNNSGFKIKYNVRTLNINIPDDKRNFYLKDQYTLRKYIKMILKDNLTCNDKIILPTPPNEYSILACLEKDSFENLEDFCSEFGYDANSRLAENTYNACKEQYLQLAALYSENEMNELREIQ